MLPAQVLNFLPNEGLSSKGRQLLRLMTAGWDQYPIGLRRL